MAYLISHHNSSNRRSNLLLKNILSSFIVKGWSAIVVLMMVPLTLKCLGAYQNGVWLTISSLLVWIDQMDIGLGNGLRNRLAVHLAHDEHFEAQRIVSSTFAMLVCLTLPVMLILLVLVWQLDVYVLLNVDPDLIPELRTALACGVTLVCLTFIMKFINNVYMGLQLPAVSNLILATCQTVALLLTWVLYSMDKASFLNVVIANTCAPLIVYCIAYPFTFHLKFTWLRPTIKGINLHSAFELGNLGVQFFWLQIASVIQFLTANIMISKLFTPEMVTPYQITYRYMSLVIVAFTVTCMPFWNATTDAYERGDMEWIRKASQKMNLLTLALALGLCTMTAVSPWVYDIWIGDSCRIPLSMTIMMAVYIFLLVFSMRYSYFLNGIGALRLQLYTTVFAILFVPLAWIVSFYTHSIICFMAVMCACLIPGIFVNITQFNKILAGKAVGIWRI